MEVKLSEYITYDGVGLASLVKSKEVKPTELVALSYEQLHKVNGVLNAVTNERREKVLLEAERVGDTATFSGVPIFLKDASQSIEGELMTSGARLFASSRASATSNFTRK